ncbi:hypothetical protein BTO28_02070 [Domibacillus epiphyticus]|uniref:Uncharacterized protein n=1 Tax=Domibacillus epiphyticus TaxID=1714355 RepID=A0A1V2ABS2_9BACI|nr:hypothetical protein BTO28_02070 [Domibacillus epiphyticus]
MVLPIAGEICLCKTKSGLIVQTEMLQYYYFNPKCFYGGSLRELHFFEKSLNWSQVSVLSHIAAVILDILQTSTLKSTTIRKNELPKQKDPN